MRDETILISRTDSIGDVVLTLPLCSWLRENLPSCRIIFLGNTYTKSVLDCFPAIDEVLDWFEIEKLNKRQKIELLSSKGITTCIHVFPNKRIANLIKSSKIPTRIGTSHRWFHLLTCNVKLNFSRKNSELHESQLNFELLRPFGLKDIPNLDKITSYLSQFKAKEQLLPIVLPKDEKRIILHPKSKGSAVEWPIYKYIQLAEKLADLDYHVYFTGTEKEALYFRHKLPQNDRIHDMSGKFTLPQFITFISQCDAIVACSTGPLHLGAILGLKAVGIYSQTKPIHPARWRPLGRKVMIVTNSREPSDGKINPEFVKQIAMDGIVKIFE